MKLTEGPPFLQIFRFALPLMFSSMFQQIYTFADTVIVGQKLGMAALAALGGTEWLTFLVFGAIQGMTGGFGIIIARFFGAQDGSGVRRSVRSAGILSAVWAFLFLVTGELAIGFLLGLLRTPREAYAMAALYLRWIYGGIPVTFVFWTEAAILRAFGDSITPFLATALSCACNVFLDLWFVAGMGWGISGAAAATLASQFFSACFAHIRRKHLQKEFEKGQEEAFGFDRKAADDCPDLENPVEKDRQALFLVMKEQLCLGLPLALQSMITAAGGLAVQSAVNGFGIVFVAGYTAANKLYGLLETAASAYGHATSAFVSQNLGAHKPGRIRQGMRAAICLGVLTAALMSAVMLLAGRAVLLCFLTGDAETLHRSLMIGEQFLRVLSVFFGLLYLLYILRAGVLGMGNGWIPMLSGLVQMLMRVICAFLLTRYIGYTGLFWGEIAAWLCADALLCVTWHILTR